MPGHGGEVAAPTPRRPLLPFPSKVPANSSAATMEGSPGTCGAPSDSGPRVSTGRLWGKGHRQKVAPEEGQQHKTVGRGALLGRRTPTHILQKYSTSSSELIHSREVWGRVGLHFSAPHSIWPFPSLTHCYQDLSQAKFLKQRGATGPGHQTKPAAGPLPPTRRTS